MGNHHNGLPELRTGALDKPQHLSAGLAVKIAGRFVRQHDSRFGNQGAGDSHTLLLSAGKIVRHVFQFIFQPQQMNDLVQKLLMKAAAKNKKKIEKKGVAGEQIANAAKVNTRNIQYKSMADKAASVSRKDTTPDTGKKYKEGSMASKANLVKDFNNKNTK